MWYLFPFFVLQVLPVHRPSADRGADVSSIEIADRFTDQKPHGGADEVANAAPHDQPHDDTAVDTGPEVQDVHTGMQRTWGYLRGAPVADVSATVQKCRAGQCA